MLTVRPRSRSRCAFEIAVTGSILVFAILAGPWVFTSYYLRYALPGAFALVVLYSYRRARSGSDGNQGQATRRLVFPAMILVLFTVLNALTVASRLRPRESFNLSFPLASGTYYVMQGGNSVLTNPFHALSGSRLALDIVKLNAFGNRAKGVAPRALAEYEIFGEMVYSPCKGIVVAVQDDLADNSPGTQDTAHPANHVTVKCDDVEIHLAHLMQGSALVATGMSVEAKQPLGRVGNSGYSLEPHLHIGAKKGGVEVGLVFDGRWLSVNSVVIETK
jgi:hypothetical protein